LLLGKETPDELRHSLGRFADHQDPEAVLAQQQATIQELARLLEHEGFKNLAWLIAHEVQSGQGLLVIAVQYFFRRAVENNRELARSIQLSRMESLTQAQATGFQQLEALLRNHGQELEALLDGLMAVAEEMRDAVLDIHAEQQKHGDQLADIYRLLLQLME